MNSIDLDGFLAWLKAAQATRGEVEQVLGREDTARLIAEGVIVENPFTGWMEKAGVTEEYY